MKAKLTAIVLALLLGTTLTGHALAETIEFSDPKGDDNGPGTYIYPTDAVYKPGSFDLTKFEVKADGKNVKFSVTVKAQLGDPWGMGVGFATQMIFIYIDTDGKPGSGHTDGLAGLNVQFDPKCAWDKVVILSPQKKARVTSEAKTKAAKVIDDIVVPNRTTGAGKKITGKVKLEDLGGGDPSKWGYQVLMQSNEGFPTKTDLLTRRVNEFEGQHRFGGGSDYECDPHAIDILVAPAKGGADEAAGQKKALAYRCGPDGQSVQPAVLPMLRLGQQ